MSMATKQPLGGGGDSNALIGCSCAALSVELYFSNHKNHSQAIEMRHAGVDQGLG